MVFSGTTFLLLFLPVVLALSIVPSLRWRNSVLLLASLFFYIWGAGALVGILVASTVIDFGLGFVAARGHQNDDQRLRRFAITMSVVFNVGMLAWFKYAGWLIGTASDAGLWTGTVPEVTLPIGISFFTFQSMSYTIDVARGRCRHLVNPLKFALYVALFPQLIAGPIVRFHEISDQIDSRTMDLARFGEGALRFSHGLAKKVLVADSVAPIADAAFATQMPSTAVAWLGVLAYSVQIYFDFSGYSDMAIGLGRMFGFDFPENFNRPYSAVSVTDFWRRWHISLSNWFRDYVFIPLGGSRRSPARVNTNLIAVFVLTGVWHGANWTFLVWGIYHGAWLLIERTAGWRNTDAEPSHPAIRQVATFLIVTIGWVPFRAPSMGAAVEYLEAMFLRQSWSVDALYPTVGNRAVLVLAAALAISLLTPRTHVTGPWLINGRDHMARAARPLVMGVALPLSLVLILAGSFSPFLYFAF